MTRSGAELLSLLSFETAVFPNRRELRLALIGSAFAREPSGLRSQPEPE